MTVQGKEVTGKCLLEHCYFVLIRILGGIIPRQLLEVLPESKYSKNCTVASQFKSYRCADSERV